MVLFADWKNWPFLACTASLACLGSGKSSPCKVTLFVVLEVRLQTDFGHPDGEANAECY